MHGNEENNISELKGEIQIEFKMNSNIKTQLFMQKTTKTNFQARLIYSACYG